MQQMVRWYLFLYLFWNKVSSWRLNKRIKIVMYEIFIFLHSLYFVSILNFTIWLLPIITSCKSCSHSCHNLLCPTLNFFSSVYLLHLLHTNCLRWPAGSRRNLKHHQQLWKSTYTNGAEIIELSTFSVNATFYILL